MILAVTVASVAKEVQGNAFRHGGSSHPARVGTPMTPNRLMPLVYDELRTLARAYLRGAAPDYTLQPTVLVHEAYLKLVQHGQADWKGRTHFLAVGARAMRQILVD